MPGILHVGTEWWAFEIVALAAGRLGALPLAAQSVIMTVDQVLNTLPFGIGVAASSRLGNLLGARKAGHARLSSHAAVSFATAIGILVLVVLMTTRSQFGSLFSDNEDVVKLVAAVLPVSSFVAELQSEAELTSRFSAVRRRFPDRRWMGSEHGRSAPRHGQAARRRSRQPHCLLPSRFTDRNLASCAPSQTLYILLLTLSFAWQARFQHQPRPRWALDRPMRGSLPGRNWPIHPPSLYRLEA